MATSALTKENLITHLSAKDSFKHIKPYLTQIEKENEEVYEVVSKGLAEVLSTSKHPPLAKLQALRLFKEIFELAEFNCIEDLDEKIENAIYRVAAYKKDSKDSSRGKTYFVEVQKRPDNDQNRQFGVSYHLFAMEIIKCFAEWYPKDFEGEPSRFKEYYERLKGDGVVFPDKLSYIKMPDEQQRFLANYKKWIKKEQQKDEPGENHQQDAGKPQPKPSQSEIKKAEPQPIQKPQSYEVPKATAEPRIESKIQEQGSKISEAPSRIPEPPSRVISSPPSRIPEVPKPEPNKASEVRQEAPSNPKSTAVQLQRPALVPTISTVKAEYDEKLHHQLETSVANLEKLRNSLQQQNQKLKGDVLEQSKHYEQKIESQRKELQELRKRLQQKDQARPNTQPFEQKIKRLEAEVATLNADINSKNQSSKLADQRIRQLEEQLRKKESVQRQLRAKLAEKPELASPKPQLSPHTVNNAVVEKLQHQNNELQEKLAISQSLVDSTQADRKQASDRLRLLEAEKSKLQAKCVELEKRLESTLVQTPFKEIAAHNSPQKTSPAVLSEPVEHVRQPSNPIKKLPRNEASSTSHHHANDKRVHSLPKTEKYAGTSTQSNFYTKKVAANLFDITPQKKGADLLNQTQNWQNRSTKLSELAGLRQQVQATGQSQFKDKPMNTRLSIFGFRDLEGTEITYTNKLFNVSTNLLAFRKTCLTQQSVFFDNGSLQIKLTRLGGTSQFNLLITNITQKPLEVQFELANEHEADYRITKVAFKAQQLLQPQKSLSENFIVKPTNMQFRYPSCTVGIKDKLISVGMPITLLSFCKFLRLEVPIDKMFFSRKTVKSQCFQLDQTVPEPKEFFGKFVTSTVEKQQALCTVSTLFNRDVALAMKMIVVKNRCVFQLSFESTSTTCEQFARTLLQVLMFCWRAEDSSTK